MVKEIILNSFFFGVGLFILQTLWYFLLDVKNFNNETVLFTAIVAFLSMITWGIILYFIKKRNKNSK